MLMLMLVEAKIALLHVESWLLRYRVYFAKNENSILHAKKNAIEKCV